MGFESHFHSVMLSDKVRLSAFRRAIHASVSETDSVVDIGTGTGILAYYAAQKTKAQVYALEYFSETARLASLLFERGHINNVQVVPKASYRRPIEASPDVLISETIGTLGPEENTVELFYEFSHRYPSVKKLVPSRLTLWAVPVFSGEVQQRRTDSLDAFFAAGEGAFDYHHIADEIEAYECRRHFQVTSPGAVALVPPQKLVDYELGKTSRSDFTARVQSVPPSANAVHLYFEATLAPDLTLSSSAWNPLTHWGHSFVAKPRKATALDVAYSSQNRQFSFQWEDA